MYKEGDSVWLQRSYFKGEFSKAQRSNKLGAKRFGPFTVGGMIGKVAVKLDLPVNFKYHPVVHV